MKTQEIITKAKRRITEKQMETNHVVVNMLKLKDDIIYLEGVLYRYNNVDKNYADTVVSASVDVIARAMAIIGNVEA